MMASLEIWWIPGDESSQGYRLSSVWLLGVVGHDGINMLVALCDGLVRVTKPSTPTLRWKNLNRKQYAMLGKQV